MIKLYKTIKRKSGINIYMATIICDNCKKEFDVSAKVANMGRKYCNKICSNEGRGFKIK